MDPAHAALFTRLVRDSERALYAFVRSSLRARSDVEDVLQETWMAAWRGFDAYDRKRSFEAWLRGIARFKIIDRLRGGSLGGQARFMPPESVLAIADELDALAARRSDATQVVFTFMDECLATLPPPDRELIERVYRSRETCKAIADSDGDSADAVEKRLQRARLRLRNCVLNKLHAEA